MVFKSKPTPPTEKIGVYETSDILPREQVNFPSHLSNQIGICRQILTVSSNKVDIAQANKALRVLEILFAPYNNKRYKTSMMKLIKEDKAKRDKLRAGELEDSENELNWDKAIGWFKYLMIFSNDMGITRLDKETVDIK